MAVQRGFSSVIFAILGILVVVVAVAVIAGVLVSEPPVKGIIDKSIELRKATEPVERSNLISALDDLVLQADNQDVRDQWDRMMQCLAASCPDEAYLDMVLVTVAQFEDQIPESAVLINIIATAKYWGNPEHLLDFSKAMSMANEQIELLDNRKVEKLWQLVVECNNACPEKNDLYFELIGTIVQ
jgi:hypothetical protein